MLLTSRKTGKWLMMLVLSFALLGSFAWAAFSQDDVTAPVISNPQPTSLINSATPLIQATVTDNAYVNGDDSTLSIDGAPAVNGLKYDSESQTLSLQWPLPLPDGQHTVLLEARDQAGNSASQNWTFTSDTVPPAITGGAPAEQATQVFTTNSLPYYYFYVSDANKVKSAKFTIDGTPVIGATLMGWGSGQLVYSGPQNIQDGTHQARLELEDNAGNRTVRNWTVEIKGAPTIRVDSPVGIITNYTPTIKARITDAIGVDPNSVTFSVDGGPEIKGAPYFRSGYLTYTFTSPLTPTNHTVTIKAKCLNGHESVYSWQFGYDQSAPVLQRTYLLGYPDNTNASGFTVNEGDTIAQGKDLTFAVTVSENLKTTIVRLDGVQVYYRNNFYTVGVGDSGAYTFGIDKRTLADGQHTMEIIMVDYGNNETVATRHFTIAEAPKVSEETPPSLAKLPAPSKFYSQIIDRRKEVIITNTRPKITAKVLDGNNSLAAANIVFKLDGQAQPFTYDPATGLLTYQPAEDLTNEAVHVISVSAADAAGNVINSEWKFYINTYPDMPWATDKTCVSCHPNNRAIHLPRTAEEEAQYGTTCKSCHGEYENTYALKTLEQRCIACHKYQWHPAAEPAGPYHEVAFKDQLGIPTLTLDTAHLAPEGSCTKCHARSINREHQRPDRTDSNQKPINCDTCHLSTNPTVVQAIANEQTECSACHQGGDHESLHDSQWDANCTKVCHKTSLTQEHMNNPITQSKTLNCDTCHSSTVPKVVSAIANNRIGCANCHSNAHGIIMSVLPDQDIPLMSDVKWTTPVEGRIFNGEIPAALESGYVLVSSPAALTGSSVLSYYKTTMSSKNWVQKSANPTDLTKFELTFTQGTRQAWIRFQPVTTQLSKITIAYN